ncbi:MAG: extracytoplasmic sigma factor ECF [Phycisphaerae bacterium]|nr:MAG: extracytoplasmic sigma factor ECF [Phycisphaerae bacterium]
MQAGESGAADKLMTLLFEELRSLAARRMNKERRGHTLQPTALVNEAFLKMINQKEVGFQSRGHFLAVAAMAMRRILVNHAQKRVAAKRGGGAKRVPLEDQMAADQGQEIDLIALDEALYKLASRDSRKAKVVEQRFFAGIEMSQIAENLGVSLATVKRDWEYARVWLAREIQACE